MCPLPPLCLFNFLVRFLLWLKRDIEKLITLEHGGMEWLFALSGGLPVFTLPECVRAAVGMTGQSWGHHAVRQSASPPRLIPLWCTRIWEQAATVWEQRSGEFRYYPGLGVPFHTQNYHTLCSSYLVQGSFGDFGPTCNFSN